MISFKPALAKLFAKNVRKSVLRWSNKPIETQDKVFKSLIKDALHTQFGLDHDFKSIKTHQDFIERVPIRDYEDFTKNL